jgi:hypothetical protein
MEQVAIDRMKTALGAIAGMQVQEGTDFRELAELCMAIANITLQFVASCEGE